MTITKKVSKTGVVYYYENGKRIPAPEARKSTAKTKSASSAKSAPTSKSTKSTKSASATKSTKSASSKSKSTKSASSPTKSTPAKPPKLKTPKKIENDYSIELKFRRIKECCSSKGCSEAKQVILGKNYHPDILTELYSLLDQMNWSCKEKKMYTDLINSPITKEPCALSPSQKKELESFGEKNLRGTRVITSPKEVAQVCDSAGLIPPSGKGWWVGVVTQPRKFQIVRMSDDSSMNEAILPSVLRSRLLSDTGSSYRALVGKGPKVYGIISS